MKDLKHRLYFTFADKVFGNADSKIFVELAVELINENIETENLIILAGLDSSDSEEREKYFKKSLNDLNIEFPEINDDLISLYAMQLAENVISSKLKPKDGLTKMSNLVFASDFASRFHPFIDLDEDIDYLISSNSTIFNNGLKQENIDDYIVNEFELFLAIEKIEDKEIRTKAKCKNCGVVMNPEYKSKRSLFNPFGKKGFYCSKCKSSDLIYFNTRNGRKELLEEIKKLTPTSSCFHWG